MIKKIIELFVKSAFVIALFKHSANVLTNVGIHIADGNDVRKLAVGDAPVDHRLSAITAEYAYSDLAHSESPR